MYFTVDFVIKTVISFLSICSCFSIVTVKPNRSDEEEEIIPAKSGDQY